MIHYNQCPVCKSKEISEDLKVKDFTVSGEMFQLMYCRQCTFKFTQDIPEQSAIGKYYRAESYISHTDTRQGLINQLYHAVRNITLNIKRRLVTAHSGKKTGNILDIGCGTGAFLHTMQNAGWQIEGLEPDEHAASNAEKRYGIKPKNPEMIFQLQDGKYDAITMWHVMEHVHQLHEYMQKLKTLLSPNGALFIAVPNYTSYDAQTYKENWAAYDVPRHLYHFSPQSMETLVKQHGLQLKQIKPMWFDSFYVSMLSEKYKNGSGGMIKAFIQGLVSNFYTCFNKKKCSSVIYIITR